MDYKFTIAAILCVALSTPLCGQQRIRFDAGATQQTIHSFGASDCWRIQYIGEHWAVNKREAIADLLFSTEMDSMQEPKGIGLSLWRFNIGTGSHSAENGGDIDLHWRRSESMLSSDGSWDKTKQSGQQWFLEAARRRGVEYSLGFSIAPPLFMSKNGLGYSSHKKDLNLKDDRYRDFAKYLVDVSKELKLDYLSPLNEPQWDWVTSNQEGTPATNDESIRLIQDIDDLLSDEDKLEVVFGESGDIRHLYRDSTGATGRDDQIEQVYKKIRNLRSTRDVVVGHSYWSTYPMDTMVTTRSELRRSIDSELTKGGEYWQSEYCPMEKNPDNPDGGWGRDLGMNTALYVARVIHCDMTLLNASSWQWWTALSQWNYKDGLIFLDNGDGIGAQSNKDPQHEELIHDGEFRCSKTLWGLGNYSRFVRPGMVRIECIEGDENSDILPSAYTGNNGEVSAIVINLKNDSVDIELDIDAFSMRKKELKAYVTDCNRDLKPELINMKKIRLSPRSITTFTTID